MIWKIHTQINNKGDVSYTYETKEIMVYISKSSGKMTLNNNELFVSNNINFKCRNHYKFSNSDLFEYNKDEYVINSVFPSNDRLWLDVSISKKNN
ncbi:MAG: hypothetical protein N4A40_09815 [Tissierellales bacterium]|nr:hypothetical protein [Tissierellales bacterium]